MQKRESGKSLETGKSSAHLKLLIDRRFPGNPFIELETELASLGLEAQTAYRKSMPLMSSQMLGWSVLAIGIAYPFFKAFLSEAGKDSYAAVKKLLAGLWEKVLRPDLPKAHVVTAKGIRPQEYSVTITLSADFNYGRVTLLLREECGKEEYVKSVDMFLDMMLAYHRGEAFHGILLEEDENCFYGVILVAYDASRETLKTVNPYSHLDDTIVRKMREHEKDRRLR